ncbi:MAG: hypothetical protein LBO71_10835 [Prevotellaceae bacterium]|jgi:hypothetical protein|nr:hypothetical protein [Prevotellaceae bacterium]
MKKIVDFSFLCDGDYEAEVFSDGVNADKEATDYKREIIRLAANDKKGNCNVSGRRLGGADLSRK